MVEETLKKRYLSRLFDHSVDTKHNRVQQLNPNIHIIQKAVNQYLHRKSIFLNARFRIFFIVTVYYLLFTEAVVHSCSSK